MKKAKTERSIFLGALRKPSENDEMYLDIAADSHKGLLRPRNEDSFLYTLDSTGQYLLAAVADGIGGNNNGDIAGNLALKMLLQGWRFFRLPRQNPSKAMEDFLKDTILRINTEIFTINNLYEGKSPMGTTIAVLIFLNDSVVTAHAGDSRIYRLRKETLARMTCDHNIVNDLVRSGETVPKYLDDTSYGRMLTQSLGPNSEVEPEISIEERMSGDRYLVCSDGLTSHVRDFEISDALENEDSAANAVKTLLRLTLHRGAKDNITMISIYT
ncbi:MAG: Serine/threonine phosphatase stp [Lentisphaerae bacterium ADurb.Bin242]|nr:MAG: Serine/threonine phosphatase stp [Lentisphaerae bacterium ADurb.Bin242]